MKKLFGVILVAILLSAFLSACKSEATPTPAPKYAAWQYTTLVLTCQADRQTAGLSCHRPAEQDLTTMDNTLNAMGAQGWELVSVLRDADEYRLFFKRR